LAVKLKPLIGVSNINVFENVVLYHGPYYVLPNGRRTVQSKDFGERLRAKQFVSVVRKMTNHPGVLINVTGCESLVSHVEKRKQFFCLRLRNDNMSLRSGASKLVATFQKCISPTFIIEDSSIHCFCFGSMPVGL